MVVVALAGAELANLVNQAAVTASMQGSSQVTMAHLEYAKDKIIMGAERKSAVIEEANRRIVAYHEGGHALMAMHTPGALPVHKATIMPRGSALGMVSQLPEKDELSWTRRQLLARLDVAMGGRVAEELIFGPDEITSGACARERTRGVEKWRSDGRLTPPPPRLARPGQTAHSLPQAHPAIWMRQRASRTGW